MEPVVSVLISVKNHECYIAEALRSVISQSLSDWEVIVVDDGSEDSSLDIARHIAGNEPRIRCCKNRGGGPVAAYNQAFEMSRGKIIRLLGSDDTLAPDCLIQCAEALDGGDYACVYHDFNYMSSDGARCVRATMGDTLERMSLDEIVLTNWGLPGGFFACSRSNFAAIWPRSQDMRVEDHALSIEFKLLGRLKYLPEALYNYRMHPAQVRGNALDNSISMYASHVQDFAIAIRECDARTGFISTLSPKAARCLNSRLRLADVTRAGREAYLLCVLRGDLVARDVGIGAFLKFLPFVWPRLWGRLRRRRRREIQHLLQPTGST